MFQLMSIDIQPLSSYVSEKGVKQENKFSAAKTDVYLIEINQHRIKSNVIHTIHLQVRSGSERNRRHFPRISIHLQVRLDDHQLFPSSWVYSPIEIISNHPNDVKTSGLQPPSSSSTYRRINYSEWDKPGLSE